MIVEQRFQKAMARHAGRLGRRQETTLDVWVGRMNYLSATTARMPTSSYNY